jgi:hypothetical protein
MIMAKADPKLVKRYLAAQSEMKAVNAAIKDAGVDKRELRKVMFAQQRAEKTAAALRELTGEEAPADEAEGEEAKAA